MTYLSGQTIGSQVIKLRPNHIMVAYLGIDWSNFLPEIKEVFRLVVQPNPPTSPKAIEDIVNIIGWDNIQFMDNLHAKVYIHLNEDEETGKAIVGSPNLTANGLGGKGLYEAAIRFNFRLTEEGRQHPLLASFNEVWSHACGKYIDQDAKKNRLEKLKEDSRKYLEVLGRIDQENTINANRSIDEYGNEWKGNFWPVWWDESGDVSYEGEAAQLNNENIIKAFCTLSNNDQVIKKNLCGKWILHWKITGNDRPDMRSNIEWLYIHYAYPDACSSEHPYSGLLIEDSRRDLPNQPFELDRTTQQAIKKVLTQKKYISFWKEPDDGTGWKTQDINDLMSEWLADVIEERDLL